MNLFGYIQDRMFQKCLRNIRKFKRYFPLQKTLADHRARSLLEQPTSEHEQIQAIYIIYEYGYFIRYEIYIELYQKYNIQYIFFDRVLLRVLLGFVPMLCDCPVFLLITRKESFCKGKLCCSKLSQEFSVYEYSNIFRTLCVYAWLYWIEINVNVITMRNVNLLLIT